MIIATQESELSNTIKIIKGKSAYMYNKAKGINGAFWSQKFFSANLDNWRLAGTDLRRFSKGGSYFRNATSYIKRNRVKHGLPESEELMELILSFVIE